jgi:hypothetical protein
LIMQNSQMLYFKRTSEKLQFDVIPRSGATRNLVFLPKFKLEISRFARNDHGQIIIQKFLKLISRILVPKF